ncbi:MAG: 4Fe-4S binding protein [Candidatus Aramenus sp.]|nr:4Fe-4S binding protein [Candidatus Aramenus sp.]
MDILHAAILLYIVGDMIGNFVILFYVLRKGVVNRKAVFFLSSLLLYMAVEASDIAYVLFLHGSLMVEPISLMVASIPILLSVVGKDKVVAWREDRASSITLALTVLVDELSMGYAYSLAFGPRANFLIASVSNPAFGAMMLADAVFFLLLSKPRNIIEFSMFTFASSMAFMPNVFYTLRMEAQLIGSIISSVFMIVNIVMLYLIQIRRASFNAQLLAISLSGFDFLMMLGLSAFSVNNDLTLISIAMVVSMFWYFILTLYKFSDRRVTGLKYPIAFMTLANLAELAMGFGESVLGFNVTNAIFHPSMSMQGKMMSMHGQMMQGHMMMRSPFSNPFWWIFPMNPYSMTVMAFKSALTSSHNLLFADFWGSYMLIMMTTMAPFYVVMMGAEMSYLVYERYKSLKNRSLKSWTLGIIAGIPLFVWLIPYYTSFYVFGMSGMIFPVTLVPFAISLAVVILFTSLFGKRAYCNLACMSAHMWTNVFYDQFKPKKDHKFWNYFRWAPFSLMILAMAYWVLIEVGIAKPPKIGMLSVNPLDLFGMFTLNYVWWFMFFLTPVFGAYSCSRQGWCGFGTFTGIFNKVLFKVKAKDVNACKECQSLSCEKACPQKIEIREDVLSKGYTNRISCVGCGDCVEACPYNNLYIFDVTSLFKTR